jgi:hypothetical protein
MSSFTNYRNPNSNRSNSSTDDNSKDLKSNIRESRWIQPEQWDLPEIQEKFNNVKNIFFSKYFEIILFFYFRVPLIFLKFMVYFNN